MIKSLRLKGFKSFGADYYWEFTPNFTAIVGPNGSGKSNILDALKWILGEGSASGLRITKQSDLLFQGSKSRQPANIAEVILKLSSGNVQGTIKRTYSRETGSALSFNGEKILLQDLDEIKSSFDLSGEGFALIGQGEIAATIHQRPRERRKQLDDLFGIGHYRERREDSLKKLTEAQEEAQRIQTLTSELEARKTAISGEVIKAAEAQKIIDNLELIRRGYYFFRRAENEKEQAKLEIEKGEIAKKLDELVRFQRFLRIGLKYYEEKTKYNNTRESYAAQLEEINARKNSIHRRAFQLASQVRDLKAQRIKLGEEQEKLNIQRKTLETEQLKIKAEHEKLSAEAEAKEQEFSEREKVFMQAQEEVQRESSRRKKLLDEAANLKLRRSRLEADINALGTSGKNNLQEIHNLETQQKEKQIIIDKLSERKKILDEKFTGLSMSSRKQSSDVKALRRDLAHLESQYSTQSTTNIYSSGIYPEPVRIILEASKRDIINSKPEAVADVFSCSSSEIAGAVEAYLNARQYYLLVHTIEEAQEGIDFLKRNKAGRVTYLALERCRPRNRDFRINIGGKVTGWAMDLITVKNEWLAAISHLMGDLLVVEDYETAGKLIREDVRFPIVTLEGEVFAPSGTISGGTSRQRSGAVVAKQKYDEINAQLEVMRNSITEAKENLNAGVEHEKNLRLEFEEVSNQLENIREEINSEQRELNALTKNLERIISEHEDAEIHGRKLLDEYKKSDETLHKIEHELETLPDIHEESYEHVILPLQKELVFLREKLNVTNTLHERIDGELANVLSRIESAEREIDSGKTLEAENRKKLSELGSAKSKAHKEEIRLRLEIEKSNDEFVNIRRKIERLNAKLEKNSTALNLLNKQISENDAKVLHLADELDQLIELWEEKYPYNSAEVPKEDEARALTATLRRLERELKSFGEYDLGALSEDKSLNKRIKFLSEQLEDVNNSIQKLQKWIEEIDLKVEKDFTASMKKIDLRFNELFVRLFGGGEARLTLQEGASIWDRGVEIFAQPPGKKLQNMTQLSGGEQSLTSTALIFATLEEAGTSLAVLDEIDAALDEANLIRLAKLIKEYSRKIQIIAMTHRRITMLSADIYLGVTMPEPGLSATMEINPDNYS